MSSLNILSLHYFSTKYEWSGVMKVTLPQLFLNSLDMLVRKLREMTDECELE